MRSAKIVRILRGRSQFEVSLATGIPNYRLSLIENGKADPTAEEVGKLAIALGTVPAALDRDLSVILLNDGIDIERLVVATAGGDRR